MHSLRKIISGGQTGVDRAALDVAKSLNIQEGGWCPNGRRAEDGEISSEYSLKETDSSDYPERTRLNIEDADATLILYLNVLEGGTRYTFQYARDINKPIKLIDLNKTRDVNSVSDWLIQEDIKILNIAGPRASKCPEIYQIAYDFLIQALR